MTDRFERLVLFIALVYCVILLIANCTVPKANAADYVLRMTVDNPTTEDSSFCGSADAQERSGIWYEVVLRKCTGPTIVLPKFAAAPGPTTDFSVSVSDSIHVVETCVNTYDGQGNKSCGFKCILWALPATEITVPPPDTTTAGLFGQYYRGTGLNGLPVYENRDGPIDFSWGTGPVFPGGPADTVSAKWTGKLIVPTTGSYTVCVKSEDGPRLFVDATLRIDKGVVQSVTEWCATWNMTAGEHTIQLIWFNRIGNAEIHLSWSGPGFSKRIIEKTALRP